MIKPFQVALLLMFLAIGQWAHGQGEEIKHHKVMLVLGHAMTPEGIKENGKKSFLFLPSWGLDYDYRLNEDWSLGIHTDIIVENFQYESPEDIIKKRTTPLALVLSAGRKVGEHLTIIVGGGTELAKEENLALVRLGVDYGWEVGEDWEVAVNYMIDFKIDAYNTGVFGVGIARTFQ